MARKLRGLLYLGLALTTALASAQEIGSVKALTYEVVLRGDAYIDSRPVARLGPGMPITILAKHEACDWYYVSSYDKEGWLPAAALENNPDADADFRARRDAARTARDLENLSHLARLSRNMVFVETDGRLGTSTLRDTNGVLLQHYRSWGFIGAGLANTMIFREEGMAFMGEGLIEGQREGVETHNEAIWSWSFGLRARLLKGMEHDLGAGGFVGFLFQFSGYPEEKIAVGETPNSVRVPIGATISGGFGDFKELFWFFDVFFEIPVYPNFGAAFRIAWNWQ